MKIMIGSDHHGIEMRLNLGRIVTLLGHEVLDFGPTTEKPEAVDYPDVAAPIARAVSNREVDRGILICGTGIGMSIVANKFRGVRAAPVVDVFSAELSRRHNNLNVLCLSGDMLSEVMINDVVNTWLKTDFSEETRHVRRLKRIAEIEENQIVKNKMKD